jgi:hypothetical protein
LLRPHPRRRFLDDPSAATNFDFARLVEDTGYVTLAERSTDAEDDPGHVDVPARIPLRRPFRNVTRPQFPGLAGHPTTKKGEIDGCL